MIYYDYAYHMIINYQYIYNYTVLYDFYIIQLYMYYLYICMYIKPLDIPEIIDKNLQPFNEFSTSKSLEPPIR